jgi:hypothetical protein
MLPHLEFDKALQNQVKALIKLLASPKSNKVGKLTLLPTALGRLLADNLIDGWVYRNIGQNRLAFAVDSITYHKAEREDERPYVRMRLLSHNPTSRYETSDGSITFYYDDIVGRTAAEVLLKHGYYLETAELKAEYDKYWERYKELQPKYGEQFSAVAAGLDADDEDAEPVWSSKLIMSDKAKRNVSLRRGKSEWAKFLVGGDEESEDDSQAFTAVPIHPFVTMFDLTKHEFYNYHVAAIVPYTYDPSVIDKLVLPDDHRDLINTLTSDLSIFAGDEDIVRGKSGGTPILCYGAPGLGKTLTAEVYSEIIQKPLYRVHSGQLGTSYEEVEKSLTQILKRAEAWKCILLLDEADVYISKRGDDLARNAVVAAFLRTLEYFNGLLFLTTNRVDDIDDAILSRMIATIGYHLPKPTEAHQLWKVLAKQFGVELTDGNIIELIREFPKLSGRDIKQLLRLTSRYCASKGIGRFSISAYKTCAMFRGLN